MSLRKSLPAVLVIVLGSYLLLGLANSSHGKELIDKKVLKQEYGSTFQERNKLINGERYPTNAVNDQRLMDITAKWLIQHVTLRFVNHNELMSYHNDLERELINPCLSHVKTNRMFVDQLGKYTANAFGKVFEQDFEAPDNRVAIVNAALMLPPIAKLKQEDVGDLLVALLKDKDKHDIIKHFAAKSLREFFPANIISVNDNLKNAKTKQKMERDNERLAALVDFIHRKVPAGISDEERAAFVFMRRDAIASLAQAGVPAVSALKRENVVKGPVAYELIKVLMKSGKEALDPAPTIQERTEAALGLCQLKDSLGDANYNPAVAVYAVGLCLHDFTSEYSKDWNNLDGRKNLRFPKPGSKEPTMYFKITAERFRQGLKELTVQSKGTPASGSAKALERESDKLLAAMVKYASIQDELNRLRGRVESLKPKTGQHSYTIKGPEVDLKSLVAN